MFLNGLARFHLFTNFKVVHVVGGLVCMFRVSDEDGPMAIGILCLLIYPIKLFSSFMHLHFIANDFTCHKARSTTSLLTIVIFIVFHCILYVQYHLKISC